MTTPQILRMAVITTMAVGSLFKLSPAAATPIPAESTVAEKSAKTPTDHSSLYPGESVEIEGKGFLPNRTVLLELMTGPLYLGEVTTNNDGEISAEVVLPMAAPDGDDLVTVKGQGLHGLHVLEIPVTIGASRSGDKLNQLAFKDAELSLHGWGGLSVFGFFSIVGAGAGLIKNDQELQLQN